MYYPGPHYFSCFDPLFAFLIKIVKYLKTNKILDSIVLSIISSLWPKPATRKSGFFYRMILMQACQKCNFYENQNQLSGSCRVNPPIVLKEDNKAVWPVVTVEDWCGRFEKKAA